MKRPLIILTVFTILAILTACGGQPATQPPAEQPTQPLAAEQPTQPMATEAPTQAPAEEKPFKVGLLSPGPVNDQGWNQTAYDALLRMEKELGAEISYVELQESPSDFEKAFRDYASQGYQMVLGHGFQFQDSAITVAKDFPDTLFFISSSRYFDPNQPNVIGLNSDSSQAYYILGLISAKMGKGAGLVGGVEIPPISESFTGFTNGAHSVNPDFPVKITYLGNWTDVAAAKEAALSMVDEGADFLAPNANIAGNGVYQAIVEAKVWGFGTYISSEKANDFSMAPGRILANYVLDYGQGLVNVARMVRDGTFKATSNIEFGLKDKDVLYITYNDQAEQPVPEDVRKLADEAIQKIAAGEINTLATGQ